MICTQGTLACSVGDVILIVGLAWILLAGLWAVLITPVLARGPGGSPSIGLVWRLSHWWLRRRQRLTHEGLEHLQTAMQSPQVMVIANHTGGVDPLLVQAATPRLIRWMMAADMMPSGTADIWRWLGVIPVRRDHADPGSLRTALRLIRQGCPLGVFPEGRITRPPGTIRPFLEGAALLAQRTRATVLPCWISGTPDVDSMAGSILGRSSSRVVFHEPVTYDRTMPAVDIAADLRQRLAHASGWPLVDEPMPLILPGPSDSP